MGPGRILQERKRYRRQVVRHSAANATSPQFDSGRYLQEVMIYFTADQHFGHKRICEYASRPFKSVYDMEFQLIRNWNSVVQRQDDRVYVLGDFAFARDSGQVERLLEQLNGQKFLIPGNHDKKAVLKAKGWAAVLPELYTLKTEHNGKKIEIVLCHYAMRVWKRSHFGNPMLYGHSHGSLSELPGVQSFDVGVDAWDYTPVSLDQVMDKLKEKKFEPVDHHGLR